MGAAARMLTKEFLMSSLAWRCPRGRQADKAMCVPARGARTNERGAGYSNGLRQTISERFSRGWVSFWMWRRVGYYVTTALFFFFFLYVSRPRRFVFLVRMTFRYRLWSNGGIILTEGNQITRKDTCPSATLSRTNLTFWTGIEPGAVPWKAGGWD